MTDTEFNLENAKRALLLTDKARKAVEDNHWTDKPGARWHLTEFGRFPKFNGIHNTAMIFTNTDGTAHEVHIFTYAGDSVTTVTRKTLIAAFKAGEKLADKEN